MRNLLLSILFIVTGAMCAQQRQSVQGKITLGAGEEVPTHVRVQNISTKKIAPTSKGGYFTILAKPGDTLSLFSPEFATVNYILTVKDLQQDLVHLSLQSDTQLLKEVTVISKAPNLGFQPSDKKRYSPRERKLKNAKNKNVSINDKNPSAGIATDPLLNRISGRTKELEKGVIVERKEYGIGLLNAYFDSEYFTQELKIPENYVAGFQYYAVEEPKVLQLLESGDRDGASLELSRLSQLYLENLAHGKK